MLPSKLLVTAFIGLANATSLYPSDEHFAALLKRQAPGTPSYNCHDNCGTAITLSRQPNKCDNEAFKTNYNNCLQCAGPDNYNIWRMYGNTLSSAGGSCGLKTEPLAGKQDDVGPAVHVGSSSSGQLASATSTAATGGASPATTPASISSGATTTPSIVPNSTTGTHSSSRNTTASVTFAAPPQQSTNAGAYVGPADILGAILIGAIVVL